MNKYKYYIIIVLLYIWLITTCIIGHRTVRSAFWTLLFHSEIFPRVYE